VNRINSSGHLRVRGLSMLSVVSLFGLVSTLIATEVLAVPKGPTGRTNM